MRLIPAATWMAALLHATSPALAQLTPPAAVAKPKPVAKLTKIQGTVLVSQGDAMAAAANDQVLEPGARVVTTAGAKVVVAYDKGCDVTLEENQRFTVKEFGDCPALIAAVEPLTAASSGLVPATLAVIGVVGVAIYERNRRNPTSPE